MIRITIEIDPTAQPPEVRVVGAHPAAAGAPSPAASPSVQTWTQVATPNPAAAPGLSPDDSVHAEYAVAAARAEHEAVRAEYARGREVFFDAVTEWLIGFEEEGVKQPDRGLILGRMFQVRKDALGLKRYLETHRGIQSAILDCFPAMPVDRAERIAGTMAQVASALQLPLIPRIYYMGCGIEYGPPPDLAEP